MKRFLSIFLAVTMILTMIPTVFASVDEETGAVTYKFIANNGGGHADVTGKTAALQDTSGNKYLTDYGIDRDWAYLGTNITSVVSDSKVIDLFTSQRTAQVAQNSWVAYKIRVPKTATYTVSGTAYHDKSGGTNKMDIYIAPLTNNIATTFADSSTFTKSFIELGISDEDYLLGSVNNRIEETHGTVATFMMFTGAFKDVSLDKDTEYVLVFNQASSKDCTLSPATLTLAPKSVTPTITASDDTEIFIGDTTPLSAVVTDSMGAMVNNPAVTYTTEDTSIVEINNDTDTVTGLAAGTATITATYTESGTDYTDTVTITVKSAAVTYKFYSVNTDVDAPSDIIERVESVESTAGIKRFTEYGTDRPWAYLGASSGNSVSSNDYIRIFNGYLGTGIIGMDNWIAFKIKVPKSASYSISGEASLGKNSSGNIDMYIAPFTGIIKTTFETASVYSTISDSTRIAGKSFDELGISDYRVGNTSMYSTIEACGELIITDAKKCVLYADTEYVLLFKQSLDVERSITPRSVTLTPLSDAPAEEDIEAIEAAFDATATAAVFSPSITATAYTKDTKTVLENAVTEVSNGDGTYKLTAEDVENYKFLYWAKGLTAERTIVSFIPEIEAYKPTNENNILIAVYESETGALDTAKAEFYNANRQLLGSITEANEGKITLPYLPSMAGYTDATHWELYGDTEKTYQPGDEVELAGTMIFVAQYDNGPTEVTINGKPVPYGTLCEFEAEEDKMIKWWTKTVNGKSEIVSVSDTYSFCAWENCMITPVYADAKYMVNTMKIVLARLGTDAVMAEFIGFDSASVAEKGIILGEDKIAMKTANNQFVYTGLDSATEACGYAIIKNADGTTYTEILDGKITLGE